MFSGEIRDFPPFIRHFKAVIKASITHPADAAYYLREAVPSQFYSLFENVDLLRYDDVMQALMDKFANEASSMIMSNLVGQIEGKLTITSWFYMKSW